MKIIKEAKNFQKPLQLLEKLGIIYKESKKRNRRVGTNPTLSL